MADESCVDPTDDIEELERQILASNCDTRPKFPRNLVANGDGVFHELARGLKGPPGGAWTTAPLGRKGSSMGVYVQFAVPHVLSGKLMVPAINCEGGGPTWVLMRLQEGVLVVVLWKEFSQDVFRTYWSWPQTCMVLVNLHILTVCGFS